MKSLRPVQTIWDIGDHYASGDIDMSTALGLLSLQHWSAFFNAADSMPAQSKDTRENWTGFVREVVLEALDQGGVSTRATAGRLNRVSHFIVVEFAVGLQLNDFEMQNPELPRQRFMDLELAFATWEPGQEYEMRDDGPPNVRIVGKVDYTAVGLGVAELSLASLSMVLGDLYERALKRNGLA